MELGYNRKDLVQAIGPGSQFETELSLSLYRMELGSKWRDASNTLHVSPEREDLVKTIGPVS